MEKLREKEKKTIVTWKKINLEDKQSKLLENKTFRKNTNIRIAGCSQQILDKLLQFQSTGDEKFWSYGSICLFDLTILCSSFNFLEKESNEKVFSNVLNWVQC